MGKEVEFPPFPGKFSQHLSREGSFTGPFLKTDKLSAVALCFVQSISRQQEAAGVILVLLAKGQEPSASGCKALLDPICSLTFLWTLVAK